MDSAGAGNLGELVASDKFPVFAIPLYESSGRYVELLLRKLALLSVIGIDRNTLTRIESLAMIAGEQCAKVSREAFLTLLVAVLVELDTIKSMDIDVIEAGFHGSVENTIGRISEVSGQACRTTRKLIVGKNSDVLVSINGIRAYKQLI